MTSAAYRSPRAGINHALEYYPHRPHTVREWWGGHQPTDC